jgi:hypothetical protein
MARRRRLGALALALSLVLVSGACHGKSSAKKKKPAPADSAATTTTTAPDSGPLTPSPLTGVAVPASRLKRAPLIVKIDNDPAARPQAGLNQADVVVEEMVEGGVTRFAAVYQSTDAPDVGPVRSARSTDVNYFTSLSRPLFAYAGANAVFRVLVRKAVFVDVGFDAAPKAYERRADRPAPSNLFTSTAALYAKAPQTPPPSLAPLWGFRAPGAAVSGGPASRVAVDFKGPAATHVVWAWDAPSGSWRRTQNGTAHLDASGAPVAAKNVVVQFMGYKDSGLRDRTRAVVPEAVAVGEGDALYLTEGKVVKGRWSKPSLTKPTSFTAVGGAPIELTAGLTWIELAPPASAAVTP